MDEIAKLIETLRRVERLYDGATTPGERVAAGFAKERLDARLKEKMEPPHQNLWVNSGSGSAPRL